jgi:hypothetical protein
MSFPEEATHPRCYGEGYPDWLGRASNKEGESWSILAGLSSESIRQSCAMPFAHPEETWRSGEDEPTRCGRPSQAIARRGTHRGLGARRGNSRAYCVADHMIDARSQTGTPPDEQTEMRYPTRASELDHRRLQVPPSPLHDPSPNQLHAGERGERPSRACGA